MAFSPDGKRIATASWDRSVKVWDAAKAGEALLDVKGFATQQQTVSYSPAGTRLLTNTLTVVDARTGTIERTLEPRELARQQFTDAPLELDQDGKRAFSPDGTRIAAPSGHSGEPGKVTVWDARTGAELLELKGYTSTVRSVAFSPDGTQIVTGGADGTVKVWDASRTVGLPTVRTADGSGSGRLELNGDREDVLGVAFSPDGTRIVTADGVFEGPLRDRIATKPSVATVWDARTGKAVVVLKGFKGTVKSVAFSPDGKRIVTGGAVFDKIAEAGGPHPVNVGEATVWDARTGAALFELKGLEEGVNSVAFSPDGTRIVTGGVPGHGIWGDRGEGLGCEDGKGAARSDRADSLYSPVRRPERRERVVQPGRHADPHRGDPGQEETSGRRCEGVRRANGNGSGRTARGRGTGPERGVQPGRHAHRHRRFWDGKGVGRSDGSGRGAV